MTDNAKANGQAYDQDAEDLLRWAMKEHARRLLMKAVYKPRKIKEFYNEPLEHQGPARDEADLANLNVLRKRYRMVNVVTASKDGELTEIKRAPEFRVVNCCRDKIKKDQQPEVWYSHKTERASLHKVQVCGSVWTCPTCTRKINLARQRQIRSAYELIIDAAPEMCELPRVLGRDGRPVVVHDADALMLTFTIRHGYGDKLADTLSMLKAADLHMQRNSRAYRRLVSRKESGYLGRLTTTEMTHGAKGWHPHLHALWFYDRRLSLAQIDAIRAELYQAWAAACVAVGLPCPLEFSPASKTPDGKTVQPKALGVHAVRALSADEYMSKHGSFQRDMLNESGSKDDRRWTVEREMASGHKKHGKKGGRSPFQLLFDSMNGDDDAGMLFRDYARSTKGFHQLEFSHALRKFLKQLGYTGIDESEQDMAEAKGEGSELRGELDDQDFETLCNAHRYGEQNSFGQLLQICKHQGFDAARIWLKGLRKKGDKTASNYAEKKQKPQKAAKPLRPKVVKNYYVDPETGEVSSPVSEIALRSKHTASALTSENRVRTPHHSVRTDPDHHHTASLL